MQTVQLVEQYAKDVWQAVLRYRRLAVGFFAVTIGLTLAACFLLPRAYHSDAKIFVRFGRTAVMDPTATATSGQVVSLYDTRESELNSLLEVLRNRSLLDRAVETLGADNILRGRTPAQASVDATTKPSPKPPLTDGQARDPRHQQAVAKLEKNVSISVPRKTSTIIVGCKAESPDLAQQIVATLVALYMDEHLRVHHTAGSYEFFQEQSQLLEARWKEAATRLREVKNQWNIVTIDGTRKLLEGQISDIEARLLANTTDLATAEAKIESLSAVIGSLPEQIPTLVVDSPSQAVDGMRQELYKVEAREKELATKFSDKHPQVLALRSTIAELQRILSDQDQTRSSETKGVNPARQSLELALHNERSSADSFRGRAAKLQEQRTQLAAELRELNSREIKLAQLQREVELAESQRRAYADKLEQARINQQLDLEHISNLSLVQPASFVSKPSGPRKLYVLGMGLVVALLGAVGIAVLASLLDPALKGLSDIEEQLRLPVTGAVRVGAA